MKIAIIWFCVLNMIGNVVGMVRIFSTATTSTFCDREDLYGSQGYIQKIREISAQLVNVESGYQNMRLYMLLPTHFGCHLTELEIVVVSAVSPHLPDQEYIDLSDDIRNNIHDELEVKLIVTNSLTMLPFGVRTKVLGIHPRAPANREIVPGNLIETQICGVLADVAEELDVRIANIQFNPQDILVTLHGTGDERRVRNRFIVMARSRTRRIVRLTP
ncbi:MAG: hypothetical protein EOP45_19405 [Sphingobacteriaceae bacterium]|nr:MAG: hypothetical protein EOP45_19405 [Sphingobacteriaceae bacterium]